MASRNEIVAAEKIIKDHILRPYDYEFHTDAWRDQPEIPAPSELMPKEDKTDFFVEPEPWNTYQQEPVYNKDLPHNIVKGPWPSKEEYIAAHYQILREDAIASLRASVKSFRRNPEMYDDKFTHVYTDVSMAHVLPNCLILTFTRYTSRGYCLALWEQLFESSSRTTVPESKSDGNSLLACNKA